MTEIRDWLSEQRREVDRRLAERDVLHTASVARHQLAGAVRSAIRDHASGRVLEAGSGRSPYRSLLVQFADEVVTLDSNPVWHPDVVGDVESLTDFPDAAFDVVFSTQVLEHVPHPHRAISEFARVLRPGGRLIVTAPHLSVLHELPHDYFRFTEYAMRTLCSDVGLQVALVRPVGGWVSLLAHLGQVGFLAVSMAIPGGFSVACGLNRRVLTPILLVVDSLVGMKSVFPRDTLTVAVRE